MKVYNQLRYHYFNLKKRNWKSRNLENNADFVKSNYIRPQLNLSRIRWYTTLILYITILKNIMLGCNLVWINQNQQIFRLQMGKCIILLFRQLRFESVCFEIGIWLEILKTLSIDLKKIWVKRLLVCFRELKTETDILYFTIELKIMDNMTTFMIDPIVSPKSRILWFNLESYQTLSRSAHR